MIRAWNRDPDTVKDVWDQEEVTQIVNSYCPSLTSEQKERFTEMIKKIWKVAKDEQDLKWMEKGR
jgi:hypothetical protein